MKRRRLIAIFGPSLALLTLSIPASAAPIALNGDFTVNFTGNVIYTPGALGGTLQFASIVTLPTTITPVTILTEGEHVASTLPTYLGALNDFSTSGPTPLPIGTPLTFGGAAGYTLFLSSGPLPVLTFSSTTPGDTFTFAASGIVVTRSSVGSASTVGVYYSGFVNDSANLYLPNQAASLSFAFDQTGGSTGGVSVSGTFAAPPIANPGVAEPATMSLFGSALVGLGLIGRKRFAR